MELENYGYKCVKFLGNGGFGSVFWCKDLNNNSVCVKQIQKETSNLKKIKGEIYILSQLNHPRIIRFIDTFTTTKTINIVMEYAPLGTLREYLDEQTTNLDQNLLLSIFYDILMGLEYLHIRHVIHRDLKPENVLISQHRRMQICDFGISAIHDKQYLNKDRTGTVLYIAPEILNGNPSDFKADIWSLGCIFYELCSLRSPFAGLRVISEIVDILQNSKYETINCKNLGYTSAMRNLCTRMLTFNPVKRIATPEIVRDPVVILPYYNLYFDYYQKGSL